MQAQLIFSNSEGIQDIHILLAMDERLLKRKIKPHRWHVKTVLGAHE